MSTNLTVSPRRHLIGLMLCAHLACACGAHAAPDDSLYLAFGGKPGIERVMADFVPRLRAHPQIGEFFKETKPAELRKQLTDQLCAVSGGPRGYRGETMKKAHANMKIRKADFNALVEVLQQSMDAQGIPFALQRRMLARLAPVRRDVVSVG